MGRQRPDGMNMIGQHDHGIDVERMSTFDFTHRLPEETDALGVEQGLSGVGDNREKECSAGSFGASVSHREEFTLRSEMLGFLRQPNLQESLSQP